MANEKVTIAFELDDHVSVPLKRIQSGVIRFVGAISAAIAATKAIVFPIKAAAEFEQQMLNVAKTTGFAGTALTSLQRNLLDLSTQLDVSATDLAKIAAIAGQLGLGNQGAAGIAAFTETTARFASVLDVTVDTAANGLAKIANIFNISLQDAERISSAFNQLSNNSTASGEALLNVVQRLGNAAGTLNLKESLGLAATGVDFGLTLETIGTSFTKVFSNMQSRADKFAKFMGVSTEDWANIIQKGGIGALKAYLGQLLKVDAATRAYTINTLSGGGRIFSLVNKLLGDAANGYQILDKNLAQANDGWVTGTSSLQEHAKVLSGIIARLKVLGNTITKTAIDIGNLSIPYIGQLVTDLQQFFADPRIIDGFTQFGKAIGDAVKHIVDLIKWVAQLNVNWANMGQAIKLLLYFEVGKFFTKIAGTLAIMTIQLNRSTGSWKTLLATIATFGNTVKADFIAKLAADTAAGAESAIASAAKKATPAAIAGFDTLGREAGGAFARGLASATASAAKLVGAAGVGAAGLRPTGQTAPLVAQTEQTVLLSKAIKEQTLAEVEKNNVKLQGLKIQRSEIDAATVMQEARIADTKATIAQYEAQIKASSAMGALPAAIRSVQVATTGLAEAQLKLNLETQRLRVTEAGLVTVENEISAAMLAQEVVVNRLVAARGRAAAASVAESLGSVARRAVVPFQDLGIVSAIGGLLASLKSKFTAFTAVTGAMGIAVRGLGLVFRGLGYALRFAISPWGTLILIGGSLLGVFDGLGEKLTEFFSFLGFTTKAEQEAARQMRITNAAFEEQQQKVRGLSDAYDQLVAKQGKFHFQDIGSVISTGGDKAVQALQGSYEAVINGINAQLQKLKNDFDSASKSLLDAQVKIAETDRQLTAVNTHIDLLNQQKTASQQPTASALTHLVDYDALIAKEKARGEELKKQKEELFQQRDALQSMVDSYNAGFNIKGSGNIFDPAIQEQIIELTETKKDVLKSLAQFGDYMTAKAAQLALNVKKAAAESARLAEQVKPLVDIQKRLSSAPAGTLSSAESAQLTETDKRLEQLRKQQAEADAALLQAQDAQKALEESAVTSTSRAQVEKGRQIVEGIKDEAAATEANAAIQTKAARAKSDYIKAQQLELNTAVGIVTQTDKVIDSYKRIADEATRVGKSITAFSKKVESELDKLSEPINKVRSELSSIASERETSKGLSKQIKFISDTFDEGAKSARRFAQAKIDALRAAGNEKDAKAAEAALAASEAFAEKQKADLITAAKAKAAFAQMEEEVKQLVRVRDNILALQKQAEEARNSDNLQLRDAIQRQLEAELGKAEDLNKSLAKARKDFAQGVYDITSQGIETPAIDTKQLDALLKQVETPVEEQRKATETMIRQTQAMEKLREEIAKAEKKAQEAQAAGDYKTAADLYEKVSSEKETLKKIQDKIATEAVGTSVNDQIKAATRETTTSLVKDIQQIVSDIVAQFTNLKQARDDAQKTIDRLTKDLHVTDEAYKSIKAGWEKVGNVFTTLADTINQAGIGSALGLFQTIDPNAISSAFSKIDQQSKATAGATGQLIDQSKIPKEAPKETTVKIPTELEGLSADAFSKFREGAQAEADKHPVELPAKITTQGTPAAAIDTNTALSPEQLNAISTGVETAAEDGFKKAGEKGGGYTTEEFARTVAVQKILGDQVTEGIDKGAAKAKPKITGIIYEIKDKKTGDTTITDQKPIDIAGKIVKVIPPKEIPAQPIVVDPDTFTGSIQDALSGKTFYIAVQADVTKTPGGAPGYASGGPIIGPGTGTSDSIMAWLSHGEYVIDAMTTRFFGSDFFRNLQYAVRKGLASPKAALSQLLMPSMKNKTISNNATRESITRIFASMPGFSRGGPVAMPRIPAMAFSAPAFASGGSVDSASGGLVMALGEVLAAQKTTPAVTERTELAIDIGGSKYTVQGHRDQVRGLVTALKDISRSTRRT